MLLLLSCSAAPGLASLRHDQTLTAHLTGRASQSGPRRAATVGMTPGAESARSPTRPPLSLAVAMRPGAFATGGATALARASRTPLFGYNRPRSDRAISLGWARTVGTGGPGAGARYRPP